MKKILIISAVIIILLAGGSFWSKSLQNKDSNIINSNGIHWHPELEIYVDDKIVAIPKGIGLIGVHSPIHTHDDVPILHLEFEGLVTREDIKLKRFFEVWGKDINDFGSQLIMTVNGKENTELGEYQMQDIDKIVLRYSKKSE